MYIIIYLRLIVQIFYYIHSRTYLLYYWSMSGCIQTDGQLENDDA